VAKTYGDLDKSERDDRWRESHQKGARDRQAQLEAQGVKPGAARREADRQQTEITNRARDNYTRADGKD
jgi:hypothetical protein